MSTDCSHCDVLVVKLRVQTQCLPNKCALDLDHNADNIQACFYILTVVNFTVSANRSY